MEGIMNQSTIGFRPAFLDFDSQSLYLDGLPRDMASKPHVIPGYVRGGFFYTRAQAARLAREVTWRHAG
jgi:hypothetical protein